MAETKDDELEEALARYKLAEEAHADNRKLWLEDVKFLQPGGQWPDKIRKDRENENLPCLEVDKLNQYIRQVVNDGRQNRPAVKVRPVDGEGDPDVAEAFQGLIRNIWDRSKADQAIDTSLEHAASGGFGFFRILTEYEHEYAVNQEIVIRRVRNPLTIFLDPNAQEADGSDAKWGFVVEEIPKEVFARKWPKAEFTDWQLDSPKYSDGWTTEKNVRVCEYFYAVEETTYLHRLVDGTTITAEEYAEALEKFAETPETVPAIEKENIRETTINRVKWCRLTGAEVLERNEWRGKYIPIIPVYGNEIDVNGKVIYSGLIRPAKDPQRLYNYSRSKFAERVALTPKAPWIIAEGQVEGYEDEWRNANTTNLGALTYKAIDINGTPVPPPQRVSPSDVPSGFAQDMQQSEHDIQAALGMYSASLGEKSNEKSGKAIMARQREGDTATFHYADNLNRAIAYLGRQLVDLIPKIYDSKRAARLLGEDGTSSAAIIDPESSRAVTEIRENGKAMKIYNLHVGRYDVAVSAGPSYTTKRQESAEAMMQLVQANPAMWNTHGDLIVKAQDWPGADEFAKRSKLLLPPEIREAEAGDGESPEVKAVKAQAQQVIDQAMQRVEQAEGVIAELQQENKDLKSKAEAKLAEVEVKAYEAETERLKVVSPLALPELIQAVATETLKTLTSKDVSPGPRPPPQEAPPEPAPAGFFTPEVPQ